MTRCLQGLGEVRVVRPWTVRSVNDNGLCQTDRREEYERGQLNSLPQVGRERKSYFEYLMCESMPADCWD